MIAIGERTESNRGGFFRVAASTDGEACVATLLQIQVNLTMMVSRGIDAISDAVICLSQSGPDPTMREACVADLVRKNANPNTTVAELFDANTEAVICLART